MTDYSRGNRKRISRIAEENLSLDKDEQNPIPPSCGELREEWPEIRGSRRSPGNPVTFVEFVASSVVLFFFVFEILEVLVIEELLGLVVHVELFVIISVATGGASDESNHCDYYNGDSDER